MEKVGKPTGLIRYASENEMNGKSQLPLMKRPRVLIYLGIFVISVMAIIYGLMNIPALEMHVVHDRQPLYVKMSDGTIQNGYTLKVLNKLPEDLTVKVTVHGLEHVEVIGLPEELTLRSTKMIPYQVRLKMDREQLSDEKLPVYFRVQAVEYPEIVEEYDSFFVGPAR